MSTRTIVLSTAVITALALGYYLACEGIAPSMAAPPAESRRQVEPGILLAQIDPNTVIDLPMTRDTLIESPTQRTRNEIIRRPTPAPSFHGAAEIGGERISLRFRLMPRSQLKPGLDDGKSGGFFEPLAAAARGGNDVAAHQLYEALRKCRYLPKTQAEFDARVAAGRKAWVQTGGFVAPGETQDLEEGIANLKGWFKRCEGVTSEMDATAIELLRESVDRGYDDNRLLYADAI